MPLLGICSKDLKAGFGTDLIHLCLQQCYALNSQKVEVLQVATQDEWTSTACTYSGIL